MRSSGSVALEAVSWATGTLEALNWTSVGGCIPGGAMRRMVLESAPICAMAPPMSVPGWK